MSIQKSAKIYIAGHRGMVGSALERELRRQGFTNLLLRTRAELDLMDGRAVAQFFAEERPEYVFLAAALAGGIHANATYPADFIYQNLQIQNSVIHQAHLSGVAKLLFLGSSCIYPKLCPQPMKEEYLLTGPLEPTNEPYALAKIAGIRMCQSYHRQHGSRFISAMPTNLYGINDNFHPENSHVLPALLLRFHQARLQEAPEVVIWGSGAPRREFLYADDLAEACVFLMENYEDPEVINVGCGEDQRISELAELVRDVVGCRSRLVYDTSKPDGTPQKLLDIGRIRALGWEPRTPFREGLARVYEWYCERN